MANETTITVISAKVYGQAPEVRQAYALAVYIADRQS